MIDTNGIISKLFVPPNVLLSKYCTLFHSFMAFK